MSDQKKLNRRKAPQPNGLFEPYTVMLDGRAVVVRARSQQDAVTRAKKQAETDKPAPNNNTEVGDGS